MTSGEQTFTRFLLGSRRNRCFFGGITLQIEGTEPTFCSWKSLPKLVAYEMEKKTPQKREATVE